VAESEEEEEVLADAGVDGEANSLSEGEVSVDAPQQDDEAGD